MKQISKDLERRNPYSQLFIGSGAKNIIWTQDPDHIFQEVCALENHTTARIKDLMSCMLPEGQTFEELARAEKTAILQSIAFVLRAEQYAEKSPETIAA